MAAWKTRELDPDPAHDAGDEIPEHVRHLAWLLQVPVAYVLRNPKSYTPRTHGTGDAANGHIDPCKLME